jgi:hypothetical protein
MPEPGEDPGLDFIVREDLAPWLKGEPPADARRRFSQKLRAYLMEENKRKNLVGEGFEDVLAAIVRRLPGADSLEVKTRTALLQLPGFYKPKPREKEKKVDLAVLAPGDRRILVTAKWSVRADREEQFEADYAAYVRRESLGKDFDYVLVTNEFDAARIGNACTRRWQNALIFSSVVHVNPEGVLAAYSATGRGAALRVPGHRSSGRLIGLKEWLESLLADDRRRAGRGRR